MTHPVADMALEVAGGWWTRLVQIAAPHTSTLTYTDTQTENGYTVSQLS